MDETMLHAAARRAYERGRIEVSLRRSVIPSAATSLALYHCLDGAKPAATLGLVLATAALVVYFTWRGQESERGARAGFVAGVSPLLVPLLAKWSGMLCGATICGILPAAAVLGGFLGGLVLMMQRGGRPFHAARFWIAAATVTVTLGTAGCLHAGLAGLGGMALGLATGIAPVLTVRALRAR
jgi:hypothetical protein